MLKKSYRRWRAWGALLIIASLLGSACAQEVEATRAVKETALEQETVIGTAVQENTSSPAPPTPEAPPQGGTLVIAVDSEPTTLDVHKHGEAVADIISNYFGASLVTIDPQGNFVGYLAESWETSEDGLTWTFHLKKGITFHNGTPYTAQDQVWTWERALDPETASPVSAVLLESVASVQVVDDYTFQATLSEPSFPFLLTLGSGGYLQPLSQKAVEAWGEQYGRHPVSVGPYRFKVWVTGEKIVLERNPDFNWGPDFAHEGPPYIDEIEFRIIPDYATILAGLEAGEIDLYEGLQAKDVDRIRESGKFQFHQLLLQGMYPSVAMNTAVAPLDDVRVRQALNLAVDRETLIKIVARGQAEVQYGPMSSSMMSYWYGVEQIGYGYDLEQARALMAEAGWGDADGDGVLDKDGQPLSLTFKTNANIEEAVKVAEILQEQYKALGMDLEIQQLESGNLIAEVFSGNFEIAVVGYSWTGDVDILYLLYHSSQIGASNASQVNDPELDEILEKTRTTMDPEERQAWADAVQRRIVEQAYCVPLYTPKTYTPISNRVHGWYTSPVYGWLYLDGIYIEE